MNRTNRGQPLLSDSVCLRRHGSHVGSVQPAWGHCLANSKPGHPSPDSTWLLLTSAYSPSGHGLVAIGRDATCLAHSISEIIAFDLRVEPMSLARTFHINIMWACSRGPVWPLSCRRATAELKHLMFSICFRATFSHGGRLATQRAHLGKWENDIFRLSGHKVIFSMPSAF